MCFSATASFAASGGLIALGGATFISAKKEDKILAAVPLMFGVQQAVEGIQWLYLYNGYSSLFLGYVFLFFAFIVWPIYVPTFVYILDKNRQKILKRFIVLGVAVALYSVVVALTKSLYISEIGKCVNYSFNYSLGGFLTVLYLIAVFGPFFASSIKIFKFFGLVFAFFASIAWIYFTVNFVSIWCFFAAIVSFMFLIYIKLKNHAHK